MQPILPNKGFKLDKFKDYNRPIMLTSQRQTTKHQKKLFCLLAFLIVIFHVSFGGVITFSLVILPLPITLLLFLSFFFFAIFFLSFVISVSGLVFIFVVVSRCIRFCFVYRTRFFDGLVSFGRWINSYLVVSCR